MGEEGKAADDVLVLEGHQLRMKIGKYDKGDNY